MSIQGFRFFLNVQKICSRSEEILKNRKNCKILEKLGVSAQLERERLNRIYCFGSHFVGLGLRMSLLVKSLKMLKHSGEISKKPEVASLRSVRTKISC